MPWPRAQEGGHAAWQDQLDGIIELAVEDAGHACSFGMAPAWWFTVSRYVFFYRFCGLCTVGLRV